MEQTITIRTERTTHLTVATLRVYQCLKDKLQDRAEVVDYRKIADEVGMSWNGVKYAVSALIRYGFIKKEGGKLSVNPSSPEVVGGGIERRQENERDIETEKQDADGKGML